MTTPERLARELGQCGPQRLQLAETTRQLHAIQLAPRLRFDGRKIAGGDAAAAAAEAAAVQPGMPPPPVQAHAAGTNALTIDKFDGRYLLSGGSDATIHLWDLDRLHPQSPSSSSPSVLPPPNAPLATLPPRTSQTHTFGVTALSFYPFDVGAFLSSSHDHTLRLFSTTELTCAASFSLDANIYGHATSPIAAHLLVACATARPDVRLVDLNSGASTHKLAGGHEGAILGVAWHPRREHILASAGAEGAVRLWDIRRSGSFISTLDYEDATGVKEGDDKRRDSPRARAHVGPCNGITFSPDGSYIVTAGHDERIRVWDTASGANTLAHFGPVVRNKVLAPAVPLCVPESIAGPGDPVIAFPNEKEILVAEMLEGTTLKRLRWPGSLAVRAGEASQKQGRNVKGRATCIAWRGAGYCEMFSGHADGIVRVWAPADERPGNREESSSEEEDNEENERKRKRMELDRIHRELTRQKITFT